MKPHFIVQFNFVLVATTRHNLKLCKNVEQILQYTLFTID